MKGANDDADGGCDGGDFYASAMVQSGLTPGQTYYLQVDGWAGTTGPIQIQITEIPVGVEEMEGNYFTVFPNPADESIKIQLMGNQSVNLDIFDVTGKIVERTFLNGNSNVDISKLASGVYTLRIGAISQRLIIE